MATWSQAQSSYPRLNFVVGGGYGVGRGAVGSFVGNSYFGMAGAGMNFGRMFGFDAEYMHYDLPIRTSVANGQSLNHAGGALNAVSLDGIVRAPVHFGRFGAYGIFGVGFYHRSVSASDETLLPGTVCQETWTRWWGIKCVNGFVQTQQTLSSYSKDAGGFNFGGGITYNLNHLHKAKLFAEYRYHKAEHSDVQSIVWPITVGLRW